MYSRFRCGQGQDLNPISVEHKPYTLRRISLALSVTCGYKSHGLDFCLGFVHRVYLFLTILYFKRLLQRGIYRCSPTAMIHGT
jgi:hypothetical protein